MSSTIFISSRRMRLRARCAIRRLRQVRPSPQLCHHSAGCPALSSSERIPPRLLAPPLKASRQRGAQANPPHCSLLTQQSTRDSRPTVLTNRRSATQPALTGMSDHQRRYRTCNRGSSAGSCFWKIQVTLLSGTLRYVHTALPIRTPATFACC